MERMTVKVLAPSAEASKSARRIGGNDNNTSPKRWPSLPDTPTFTELGLEKLQVLNICGLVGPAGLDPGIVEKLRDTTAKALANPAVREGFTRLGVEIDGSGPQAFAAFIKEDLERWACVIKEGNVKVR